MQKSDPEVAYLHLITAGEVLANVHHPQNEDLLTTTSARSSIRFVNLFPMEKKSADAC